MIFQVNNTILFENLDDFSTALETFFKTFEILKISFNKSFEYKLEYDYDTLTIKLSMLHSIEDNDNTERSQTDN